MKSPIILTIGIVVLAVAAGPFIYFNSVAADSSLVAAEFSRLEKSANENVQDWLRLAESIAGSEQNAPSHDQHCSGEVAERLTNSPGANLDARSAPAGRAPWMVRVNLWS